MKINTGLAVRKAMIIFLIVLASWQLRKAVKPEMSFFPVFRIFSVDLFLSQRLDPVEMMESVSKDIIKNVQDVWKKHRFEVKFIREEKTKATADSLSGQNPFAVIFYKDVVLNGQGIKEPVSFSYNKYLISFIKRMAKERGVSEDVANAISSWEILLGKAKEFSLADYEKMRSEFPRIGYSFEEIRQLRISGMALAMITSFVYILEDTSRFDGFSKSMRNFKESEDLMTNVSVLAYPLYFYERKYLYCWMEALRQKGFFVLTVFFLAFLSVHLFQKDAVSLLDEKLRKGNLQMDWKYRLCSVAGCWKLLVSVAKRQRRELMAEKICDKYAKCLEEMQSEQIVKESEEIWADLKREMGEEELTKRKDLRTLYQISSGKGKNDGGAFAFRFSALKTLQVALGKARKANAETAISNEIVVSCNADRRSPYQVKSCLPGDRSNRKKAICAEIGGIISEKFGIDLESLSFNQLTNLKLVISCLGQLDESLAEKLVSRPDLANLLKNESELMSAVRTDNKEAIMRMLDKKEKQSAICKPGSIQKRLPENLRVIIIGGDRTYGKKQELIKAVKSLGPKEVVFLEAKGVRQVGAAARTDPENTLLILAHVPHGILSQIYNREGLRWLFIDPVSYEKFKEAVIEGYYGLQ
jgi:hypothetical protein